MSYVNSDGLRECRSRLQAICRCKRRVWPTSFPQGWLDHPALAVIPPLVAEGVELSTPRRNSTLLK